jgi:hypothetical protein
MKTITIDILNEKAMDLLKNLEILKLIRLRKEKYGEKDVSAVNLIAKYKGAMSKQSLDEVDKQLNELRNGWE